MIELYEYDGVTYEVSPGMKEKFLTDFPGATLVQQNQQQPEDYQSTGYQSVGYGEDQSAGFQYEEPEYKVDWFGEGWINSTINTVINLPSAAIAGYESTSSAGEDYNLLLSGGQVNAKTVDDFIEARLEKATNYKMSKAMAEFQKTYEENGGGWFAFYKGIKENPGLLAETMVSSLAGQVGAFLEGEGNIARETLLAGAAGSVKGYKGALSGSMFGLMTTMESALTYGDLISEMLEERNLEFTRENVMNLINGPDGQKLRNRALGRGFTIGGVEALTMWGAGSTTTQLLKRGPGVGKKTTAITGGLAVEAAGGGLGEVLGREAAGQEFDAAEVGFEAFSGLSTAPLSVGHALLTFKGAKYYLNDMKNPVEYDVMKEFIETADGIDIAKANIKMENDVTGLEQLAYEKQTRAIIDTQIDSKITEKVDREKLIDLEIERRELKRNKKKDTLEQDPDVDEKLKTVTEQIKQIQRKYKGAIGIGKTAEAQTVAQQIREGRLKGTIEFAKTQGERIGKKVVVANTAQETKQKALELGISEEKANKSQNTDGFIFGDTIVINKEVAAKTGAINVGSHEVLHGILAKHLNNLNDSSRIKLGKSFMNVLNKKQRQAVLKRLKEDYNLTGNDIYSKRGVNEIFSVFSDAIAGNEIQFNEGVFSKIKNSIEEVLRKLSKAGYFTEESFLYRKEFSNARQAYNFLKEYNENIKTGELSERSVELAKTGVGEVEFLESRSKAVEAVNVIEQKLKEKLKAEGKAYTKAAFQDPKNRIFKEIFESIVKPNGAINNYVKSLGLSPELFEATIDEMGDRLMNYDPQAERKTGSKEPVTIGEAIMANVGFAKLEGKKALAIEGERKKQERPTDLGETTKEGEVKMQVEDTDTSTMDTFEEQDITEEGQKREEARKAKEEAKRKTPKKSTFRKKLGIEDGSEMYNRILEVAKKTLMKVYDSGKTARQIQRDIRDEAASRIFGFSKEIKNLLGTTKYIENLKEFRVPIINALFTADLVQLEREVPDDQKVTIEYVETLTNEQDVVAAINAGLLPESDLARIKRGQPVNLYRKIEPIEGNKQQEDAWVKFFDQPAINPETGKRSGLKGTRKDGLAKYISGALNYDATMQVSKDPEVQARRELQLTKKLGDSQKVTAEIIKEDIQELANAINRDPDLLFSETVTYQEAPLTPAQVRLVEQGKIIAISSVHIDEIVKELFRNSDNQSKLLALANSDIDLTQSQIEKYGSKRIMLETINLFNERKIDRIDNVAIVSYIKSEIKKLKLDPSVKTVPPVHKLYEQFFLSLAGKVKGLKNLKVTTVVREGKTSADLKFSIGDKAYGIEIKMDQSRGGAYTFYFDTQESQQVKKGTQSLNKKDQDKVKQLEKELVEELKNNGFNKNDIINGVKGQRFRRLKNRRGKFVKEVDVTSEHIEAHYVNKPTPEYFINIGEAGVFYMLPENTIENADIRDAIIKVGETLNIPRLNGNFKLTSTLKIGSPRTREKFGGTRAVTVSIFPIIDSKNIDASNVKLHKFDDMSSLLSEIDNQFYLESKSRGVANLTEAIQNRRPVLMYSKTSRGMSTFDFDETLIDKGENFIIAKSPDGRELKISSAEWPIKGPELMELGYTFDFKDFVNVRGGVEGPLLQKLKNRIKKFGPENNYILTARPPESATAIHEWLKTKGIKIPLKNITGLGNSTAEAKAMWMAQKFSEGYNDMYFVDDALPNVKAVANVLEQLDIKGKSVQTDLLFSKTMDKNFNKILEEVTGIKRGKTFSAKAAAKSGAGKGRFRLFIPPSHEDFLGIIYNFLGKGEQGNKHRDFFQKALLDPLNKAYIELDTVKQNIANGFKELNKEFKDVKDVLKDKVYGDFTNEDAIRVYLWNKIGHKIPGLTKKEIKDLSKIVSKNKRFATYANKIKKISGQKEYVKPGETWDTGNIRLDLADVTDNIGRKNIFAKFFENADIIFSTKNLNKIEAAYGKSVRSAIEDILYRTKTGRNRPSGQLGIVNRFNNFIHGAVGSVMFFNMRSAILQQMSMVNYFNFSDNNIFAAAKAFANQEQYWSDWSYIFNSDMLKQRRGGIQTDVNGAELARDLAGSKTPMRSVIRKLLQLGFKPTQIGDNIAIATGGATFYRNRINRYLKQGMSNKKAQEQAWLDFTEITQSTQQSARPDLISQQQASPLGKWILAFQNVTSQFNRLGKKAALDLINRRITKPNTTQTQSDLSNLSRITYYLAVQNMIFYSLQTALFALMFDDDEDDKKQIEKKTEYMFNGAIDSILRGTGVFGAIVATAKNIIRAKRAQDKKPSHLQDESAELVEFLNLSPPIGIKAREFVRAGKTLDWNRDVIKEMETFDIDNPIWSAYTAYTQVFTNLPVNRMYNKMLNIKESLDTENSTLQRVMLFLGWSKWNLNIKDTEMEELKEKIKEDKKQQRKTKSKKGGYQSRGYKSR